MSNRAPAAIAITLVVLASAGCKSIPGPWAGRDGTRPELQRASAPASAHEIRGTVSFNVPGMASLFGTQALLPEVANAATVSLVDPVSGNTVASSVTDSTGQFVLTFSAFGPVPGAPYILEAVKGLSVGGKPNRPGAAAVRVRTLLFWNGGWQSLTNTTPNVGISVGAGTTAVAVLASLKETAGQGLILGNLIGKVSGAAFTESNTGLWESSDFDPVLALVGNALALDQDPVAGISYDKAQGSYRLATGVSGITTFSPAQPSPGGDVTLQGVYFDTIPGRTQFWFGKTPASTWSVSDDRTAATVSAPPGAVSGPFVLQQYGGASVTLDPFLKFRGTVATVAGDGVAGYQDGPGAMARFTWAWGLAIDSQGNVYVGDASNHRIRKVARDGTVSTFAGSGTVGFLDGAAATARFNQPHMLAFDPAGNLLVDDLANHAIRKVAPDGNVSTVVGTAGQGFADGPVASAKLNTPHGIAVAANGDIFVSDYANQRIRKISGGVVSTFAGSGSAGFADGAAASAQFNGPISPAFDAAGNLLVPDRFNARIRKVAPNGAVSTIVGSGVEGFEDGAALSAKLSWPNGVAIAPSGEVYFTEEFSYRLRKLKTDGTVETVAGNGIAGSVDGLAKPAAQVGRAGDLRMDAEGNVWWAEMDAPRIRVFTP